MPAQKNLLFRFWALYDYVSFSYPDNRPYQGGDRRLDKGD